MLASLGPMTVPGRHACAEAMSYRPAVTKFQGTVARSEAQGQTAV